MKTLKIVAALFFLCTPTIAQTDVNFDTLKKKVRATEGKEKLKWLDSLATETYFARGKNYDSLALETIALSIELDTADVGAYHIVNYANRTAITKGPNEAIQLLNDFEKEHIGKLKSSRRIMNIYKANASYNYRISNYETSLQYYDKALEASIKTTDSQAIGEIYMGKGMITQSKGNLLEASQLLQKSIPYFKASGGINAIINVKNVMTSLYSTIGFYEEAQKEREEALALAKQEKHYLFQSQLYFNHASEWLLRDSIDKSIPLLKEAITKIDSSKNYKRNYKPIFIVKLASVLARNNELVNAEYWLKQYENSPNRSSNAFQKLYYTEAQMDVAFARKDYQKAQEFGLRYLKINQTSQDAQGLKRANLFLSQVAEKSGNTQKSFNYYKKYQNLKDSLTGVQKTKALSYYQTLYETEKRDATIANQEKDIALLDAKNSIQRQWILFGGLSLLLLAGLLYFWRSRKAVQKERQLQKQFSQDLLNAQENERKAIAKELHDSIGQDLLLIKNSLTLNPEESSNMVDKTIEDIRSLSRNLHPVELEKFGLTKAIENLVARVSSLTSIYFTEEIDNIDNAFSQEEGINLYRIIQECISNIIKHSQATASKLTIDHTNSAIVIKVQDNGKGFKYEEQKTTAKSLGLQSLMERVDYLKGKIEFDTNPKQGTSVIITLFKQ